MFPEGDSREVEDKKIDDHVIRADNSSRWLLYSLALLFVLVLP